MKADWQSDDGAIQLYRADCRVVLPELEAVDAVVTSPPYLNQRAYKGLPDEWDELLNALLDAPDCQMLVNLGLVHRDGECVPYWEPWRERMRSAGWRFFGWYVWDQGFGLPGDWCGRLAPSHEFVFHFNKTANRPNKWIPTKSVGRKITGMSLRRRDGTTRTASHIGRDVQLTKIPDSVIRIFREMRRDIDHPARFPVEFASHLVRSFSPCEGVAVDPFMGSGTTGVACVKTGRKFIGIEIDPGYFDIAVKRIKKAIAEQGEMLPLEASA